MIDDDRPTTSRPLPAAVSLYPTPEALLSAFTDWVAEVDPDLLIGWNVIEFDLQYLVGLAERCGHKLALGRSGGYAEVLVPRDANQPYTARVPGRVVLDGIATLRSATWSFESFALENVARSLLGRGKRPAFRRARGNGFADGPVAMGA